jgi:hypothetical protein
MSQQVGPSALDAVPRVRPSQIALVELPDPFEEVSGG